MPHLIDSESRTDCLSAAVTDLLVREGIEGLTLRRLARASGISTSSMLHHYGSREHLFRVLAARCGSARLEDIHDRRYLDKVAAFLPVHDDQLAVATSWLAWVELARCEPAWQRTVGDILERERGMLSVELGLRFGDERVNAVSALVWGLIGAMARWSDPMAPEAARQVLDRTVPLITA